MITLNQLIYLELCKNKYEVDIINENVIKIMKLSICNNI